MKTNRIKNTKRNARWGIIEKVSNLLFQFIIRTIIIKKLGEDFLGLNSLFTSILQVMNMAELGFSSAIIYSMYKPIAENDVEAVCGLMNFYKKIYRILGIVVLCIGLILIPFLNELINGEIPNNCNLYLLYFIYLLNTLLSYFLFAYKSCILEVSQRNDILCKVRTILMIFQYTYQIIIIFILKNYYLYLIIMPFITILNNLINAIIVQKMYPEYVCRGEINKQSIKQIKKNVFALSIGKLCIVSRNSLDSIFLSAYISLAAVAKYNNYYYIIIALNTILSVITSAMGAGVGNSIATEKAEKNYEDFIKFNFIYMIISGWCMTFMLCLYQPFMKIWMGEKMLFPFETVILFCLYFYSLKLGDIRSIYSSAAGLFCQSKSYVIVEAIANGILNYILVKIWGINGIIIATNLTIIFINFVFGSRVLFKFYFKNKKLLHFYIQNIKYFIVALLCSAVCFYLGKLTSGDVYYELLINVIICLVVPIIINYLFYHKSKEFKESVKFIKKTIRL